MALEPPLTTLPVLNSSRKPGISSEIRAVPGRGRRQFCWQALWPIILTLISSLALIPSAEAQRDPVRDFCRRWGHQAAVVDNRLFIDGGYVNWEPIGPNPQNFTNEWFLYHDLSSNDAGGMPPLKTLTKNSTVPDVTGGALWADTVNKKVYLFGGEFDLNVHAPPSLFSLFAYDALHDFWEDLGRPDIALESPSFGGNVAVPEHGLGFFYGGWLNNATVPGRSGTPLATDSLVVYDMDQDTWKNKTGPDNIGRAEGVMVYIPAGDNGFLVYFGGLQDRFGNGTMEGQPMDQIFLYDFVAEKWYSQMASGFIPDERRRFCGGAAWADDFSSYNIYIYGGLAIPPNGTAFDDVWILTIPTFTWMKWHPDDPSIGPNGEYPHHSLTCNVIGGGSQMIIIGGVFPYSEECDSTPHFGSHGLYLGEQNEDKSKWETLNTTLDKYEVPDIIIDAIGGVKTGGATETTPIGGFDSPDLKILMTRTASASTRTPTRDVELGGGTGISTGAIVGISVGGAAALISALVLGWCCLQRRGTNNVTDKNSPQTHYTFPAQPASPGTSPPRQFSSVRIASPRPDMPGPIPGPAELPGAANVNIGTWEFTSTGAIGSSPHLSSPDGKVDYVLVPVPVHSHGGSHSSSGGHSSLPQSPTDSMGYPLGSPSYQSGHLAGGMFTGSAVSGGGYVQVPQTQTRGDSPLESPSMTLRTQPPTTPQELSTERRQSGEEPSRRDEILHQTYYNCSYADVRGETKR